MTDKNLESAIETLKQIVGDNYDYRIAPPIAKALLSALTEKPKPVEFTDEQREEIQELFWAFSCCGNYDPNKAVDDLLEIITPKDLTKNKD